jgi:hypothetical protein
MDKRSGSLAYNRLDMQISQVFHLAIELYDSSDYMVILDHDDDITVYDDQERHDSVSFYQMKTKDDSISLSVAINEGWLEKLYSHMNKPGVLIKELGLITNCPIKMNTTLLSSDRTPFDDFGKTHIDKIKADIARRRNIAITEVDLSKMIHMRTTLSIDAHKQIVESEASTFLVSKFPSIKVQVVKTIVAAVFDILGKRQSYERLSTDASYADVTKKKGFSRTMFDRIIKTSIKINIPEYDTLVAVCEIPDDKKEQAALAYTKVLADSHNNTDSFIEIFDKLEQIVSETTPKEVETVWTFAARCKAEFSKKRKNLSRIYADGYYLEILTLCIYLAKEENNGD